MISMTRLAPPKTDDSDNKRSREKTMTATAFRNISIGDTADTIRIPTKTNGVVDDDDDDDDNDCNND